MGVLVEILAEQAPVAGRRTLELLETARNYNRWLFERVQGAVGSRVLEVGSGTGTITQFMTDRELVVGVEVVEEYVEVARHRVEGHSNVLIRRQDITRSTDGLDGFRFNSAIAINVIEHIEDDLGAMRAVFDLLEPGGCFAMVTPSHPWLMSPFDRAIGHCRRYTKSGLRRQLETAGFVVKGLRRSNPVGALGWMLSNVVLRRTSLFAMQPYDRMVPLFARLDRIEFPVGLSLVAVAQKPYSPVTADR
jgi:SAM-dependent methyltransferase